MGDGCGMAGDRPGCGMVGDGCSMVGDGCGRPKGLMGIQNSRTAAAGMALLEMVRLEAAAALALEALAGVPALVELAAVSVLVAPAVPAVREGAAALAESVDAQLVAGELAATATFCCTAAVGGVLGGVTGAALWSLSLQLEVERGN